MTSGTRFEIGSPEYQAALEQEAAFWEGAASGAVGVSVATWRDAELSRVVSGDLHTWALDLAATRGTRILELGCGAGSMSIQLASRGCDAEGIDICAWVRDSATWPWPDGCAG